MYPIEIIGIGRGKQDLTHQHLGAINNADILVGGRRQLALFTDSAAQKIPIRGHVDDLVADLEKKATDYRVVVLASGDPLFHGIGAAFCRLVPREKLIIHPNVSCVAAAFSAIKEPWHDAKLISLHGSYQANFSFSRLADEHKVLFLTDPGKNPGFIARELEKEGLFNFKFCVLENIGDTANQKVSWFDSIDLVSGQTFSQPNVVILLKHGRPVREKSRETHIGMDDTLFRHSKGLITKSEIRTVSLSKLKLIKKNHIFWDIGSGSGSVAIEASFLIPWGHVIAIEKNTERISNIIHNIRNFNCSNIKVLNAAYPEGTDGLKPPDRIFIGGGGKHLGRIITSACRKLADHGVIVINTVLLQNLDTALDILKKNNFNPEVVQLNVSRSKSMPFGDRFDPLNPVWIISGSKPVNKES